MLGGLAGLVGLSAVAGVLITATVTPAIAVSGAAASSAITMFDNLPSVLQIDDLMQPTTLMYSDGTTQLATFFDQNRSPVKFDQIATVMYDSILSSEDPRFYDHGGVDLIGTTRAVLSNLKGGGETQGGSSISQQYVKNILVQQCEWNAKTDDESQACFYKVTNADAEKGGLERKLQEMRYAIALEQQYSKQDILLGYLNIANFGGTTYGIDAAAKRYFGIPASQLSLAQAATLAGIVQNPNTYRIDLPDGTTTDSSGNALNSAADGYSLTKKRQTYVLDRLLTDGKITQEQHDQAVAEPITPHVTEAVQGCAAAGGAAYFCQWVVSVIKTDPAFGATEDDRMMALRRGGLKIITTLDPNLQGSAAATMADYVPSSIEGMDLGATSVNLQTSTGRILAIAQNTKFSESASTSNDPNYSSLVYAGDQTNGRSTGFNAGSTFKLFTLIDWLEKGNSVNAQLNGVNRTFKRFTNTCSGDWVNTDNWRINNFSGGGFYGTPMQFTAQSLNSGYLAMAEKLDLCDIGKVATKMGVLDTYRDAPVKMSNASEIIGSDAVSPLAMAGAYATVANNGIYCQPQGIDKVFDSAGNELPDKKPKRTCSQVITPQVAATAAYALKGVMAGGGTGSAANPRDGSQLIGKTGTHEQYNSWMIESSTAVTTAVWVGNSNGLNDIFNNYANGTQVSNLRYPVARDIQARANELYAPGAFPDPDSNLIKTVYVNLPNVVGMTLDQARQTLASAGFQVTVGDPVDSDAATDVVAAQNPGAGSVASGTSVTINASNGQGATVPAVSGTVQSAQGQLQAKGFTNISLGTCTPDPSLAGNDTRATSTDPAAGTATNKNTAVRINYSKLACP